MKILVAVIVLVILGGGFWVTQRGDNKATTDDIVEVEDGAVDLEADNQIGENSGTDQTPESQSATVTDIDSAVPGETTAGIEESAGNSPFATVAEPEAVAEPQNLEPDPADSESVSSVTNTSSADQDGLENTERRQIVVPQSYPVTEAAKYFIPKDERGPGRLGGPPPLDFPGGPSDPNRGDSGEFGPPPAPGN